MNVNEEVSFGGIDQTELEEEIRDQIRLDSGKIEGSMKYKPIRLPQERIERMLASYGTVCINDFGDEYNLTEEERKKNNLYYAQEKKIMNIRSKYRRMDKFVQAWRSVMEVLHVIAKNNEVYDEDEFVAKVMRGKIKVGGFKFPRYCGPDKKKVDWAVVTEYVLDLTKDPADFMQKSSVSAFDLVDPSENMEETMLPNAMKRFDEVESLYDKVEKEIILDEDRYHDDDINGMYIEEMGSKEFKNFLKIPGVIETIKESRRHSNSSGARATIKQFAFEYEEDDFDMIRDMDEERGFVSNTDLPKFKGNIMKKSDVDDYLFALEKWEERHVKVDYHGRLRTIEEIHEIENKQALEDAGYNIHKFYSYDQQRKKLNKIEKREKKKEKRLQARLLKLNMRRDKRSSGINTKRKKHKNPKKDKTGYKKRVIKETKRLFSEGFDSFDDYTKEMEGWD